MEGVGIPQQHYMKAILPGPEGAAWSDDLSGTMDGQCSKHWVMHKEWTNGRRRERDKDPLKHGRNQVVGSPEGAYLETT
jgi:hypothetical protein